MNSKTTSQKVGRAVFAIGAVLMVGLGWLFSWWMVPTAKQSGPIDYSALLGLVWALSVPVGAFLVAIGAALTAQAERRLVWLLILLFGLIAAGKIAYNSGQLIPALFGIGGGLIALFFIGSTWHWAGLRPALTGGARTGSDLRMVGTLCFVVAAWYLCGLLGVVDYVLRPDLAERYAIPIGNTINLATVELVLLVLGWGFTYLGQRASHRARPAAPGGGEPST